MSRWATRDIAGFQSLIGILADFNSGLKNAVTIAKEVFQSLIGILADFNRIVYPNAKMRYPVSIPHRDFSRFQQ